MKRAMLVVILVTVILGLPCAALAQVTPQRGGIGVVAIASSPDTLDPHATTARACLVAAGIYIFETLSGFDSGWQAKPMLAKSWEYSPDLLTVTFHLREGVKFHDGSDFTAEDFIASWNRFLAVCPGASQFSSVKSVSAPDAYTIVFECSSVFTTLPEMLCAEAYFVAVFPKEIAEKNPAAGKIDIIGTGPYKLKKFTPGTEIVLERFDGYAIDDRPTDGFVGKKLAYLDQIIFKTVPEDEIRYAGLLTGEFHVAQPLPGDYVKRIQDAASKGLVLRTFTDMKPYVYMSVQEKSPLHDPRMKQAIRICLDFDKIMFAASTNDATYFLNTDQIQFQDQGCWDPTIMASVSDQANVAEAKRLAKEAGYKGEPIIFLASIKQFHHRRPAIEIAEELKAAGFNIELQLKDWAVVAAELTNVGAWDMWYARNVYFTYPNFVSIGTAGYTSPAYEDILAQMRQNTDPANWCKLLERLRKEVLIPDVPIITFGDMLGVGAETTKIKDVAPGYYSYMANAWLPK